MMRTDGIQSSAVELPGAISQGRTKGEALANIRDAIKLLLEHLSSKVAGQRVEEVVVAT
jgi:predicted RNase H-like HicB family nuclease